EDIIMTMINEILSLPHYNDFNLLNCNGNFSADETNINISENNDIYHITSINYFIFSTVVLYQSNHNIFNELIKYLNDIYTDLFRIIVSRFSHEIEQDVIDFAYAIELPLNEIPESWNLGEITLEISSFISDSETGKLNYALQVQQELNQLLIKGF